MKGAIIGDIIGSVYEGRPTKREDFPIFSSKSVFTDDTVLTVATAEALLEGGDYGKYYLKWGRKYPQAGYGEGFYNWLHTEDTKRTEDTKSTYAPPYNSWGNGAAMRVSPIAFAFTSLKEVELEAEKSAIVTHNHPEGIKGAKAIAAAIFLAKEHTAKYMIRDYLEARFGYELRGDFEEIRQNYQFDISAAGSVPQAILAFLVSENFEDAIRKAVSLGGDADTQACMAGAIAHAFYKDVPEEIVNKTSALISPEIKQLIESFCQKFQIDY